MSEFGGSTIEPSVLTQGLLDDFGLVPYEIDNCRRQIAAFLAAGKLVSKNKNNDIDNLCGWTQNVLLRLIVIDSFKLLDDSKKIVESIIGETKFHDIVIELFKASEFDQKIKLLKIVIAPWRPYRNKRYAHIEKARMEKKSLELISLAGCLKDLKHSIWFIMHYLNNPRYIPVMGKKDEAPYSILEEESSEFLFYEQMKNDRVIKTIHQLIKELNINH